MALSVGRACGSALRSPAATMVSKDGRSAMIQFTPTGTYEEAGLYIDKLVKAVDKVESRHPGFLIDETGSVSTKTAVDTAVRGGLKKAGLVSIPSALALMLAKPTFRSLAQ